MNAMRKVIRTSKLKYWSGRPFTRLMSIVTAAMDREVSDGVTTISERGVVTLVLRAEAESWVVVAEHYSFPPQSP